MIRFTLAVIILFAQVSGASEARATQRLTEMLNCEAHLAQLSPDHQSLLQRLSTVFEDFQTLSATRPEWTREAFGTSSTVILTEMTSLAGQILETRQPSPVQRLDVLLSELEIAVNEAKRNQPELSAASQVESQTPSAEDTGFIRVPPRTPPPPPPVRYEGGFMPYGQWPPMEKP